MKIYIDTANIEEIREAASWGIVDGVTTNPTLVSKEGKKFGQVVLEGDEQQRLAAESALEKRRHEFRHATKGVRRFQRRRLTDDDDLKGGQEGETRDQRVSSLHRRTPREHGKHGARHAGQGAGPGTGRHRFSVHRSSARRNPRA